jgi:outer membrane receptor protein involved in Fe transport
VRGHSGEITFATSRVTAHVDAGGRQRTFGLFGQDSIIAGKWTLASGGRFDRWTALSEVSRNSVKLDGPLTGTHQLMHSRVSVAFLLRLHDSSKYFVLLADSCREHSALISNSNL